MFNKFILLEFEDIRVYEDHFSYIFSHIDDYELFFRRTYNTNEAICKIITTKNLDFKKMAETQLMFKFSPWSIPWIEYIDNEFIATIWVFSKMTENKEDRVVFTKNFYLFVEDEEYKERLFDVLKMKLFSNSNVYIDVCQTYYFYKPENFLHPVTFSLMINKEKKTIVFTLNLHEFEAYIGQNNFEEDLLKEKNFMYFYKTLTEIKEQVWLSMNEIDKYGFIKRIAIQSLNKNAKGCI